jgi:hypothetical protein
MSAGTTAGAIALDWKGWGRMGMILRICAGFEWLHVVITGEFSLEEAKRTFLEMLDAVAQHKTAKLLLDGRELQGEPTTIQRFLYGEFAAYAVARYRREHGLSHILQCAYVLHEPVLDPQRFGETVAVNRGMWVKAFDNPEDALVWLGVAPVNKPEVGHA